MNKRKIRFEKIKNARELGGLPAAGGKHIRHDLLIRCGHLGKATEKDIALLTDTYRLRTIVDFRIDAEIKSDPDVNVPGAEYENLSVLDSSIFGIARDSYSLESWLNLFKEEPDDPEKVFGEMYRRILFSERVIPFVKRFFDILLEDKEGAVLWHCSAGKDRVGVMTLLLLSALGVPEEEIVEDYLLTGETSRKEIRQMKLILPFKFKDKNIRNCVYVLLDVREKYLRDIFSEIKRDHGSTEAFLEKRFGIGEKEISALRAKYLE